MNPVSLLITIAGQNYLYKIYCLGRILPVIYHKTYRPVWNFKIALSSSSGPTFFHQKRFSNSLNTFHCFLKFSLISEIGVRRRSFGDPCIHISPKPMSGDLTSLNLFLKIFGDEINSIFNVLYAILRNGKNKKSPLYATFEKDLHGSRFDKFNR